ncbi:MAG: hypothetical protein HY275_09635 [Gemmatimonadetes bacterium]|nr:hypothetical protein [Gemmatimonadota bacterium]
MPQIPMSIRRPAVLVAALLALAPTGAQAQFGSLLKKVGEKAVDKATGAEDKVAKNPNGAELTDDALGRLLKGLAVTAEKMGQREELQQQLQAKDGEARALREPNETAIRSWERASSDWQGCVSNALSKGSKARDAQAQSAMMKVMADPKKQQAYAQLTQKYSAAQQAAMQAGDTAKLNEASRTMIAELNKLMGIDLSADSAKARATCGAEPRKLAVMTQLETLERQRDTLQVRVRDLEATAQTAGAKAAGMDLADFALQREKATTFLGSGNGGGILTRDELNRLRAKRAELEKVKKAL